MNIRTARDILGFPSCNNRQSVERNRTHPKHEQRIKLISPSSISRGKNSRTYFEHRIQNIQISKTPILASIRAQINAWQEDISEDSRPQSQQLLSYSTSQEKKSQVAKARYIQGAIYDRGSKKLEEPTHWPRINRTEHQIKLQKQQNNEHSEVLIRNGRHVFRRPTIKGGINERHASKPVHEVAKDQKYYISDIKKSVHEYMNNRQYVNPYLSHLMDSISAFEVNMHLGIPKFVPKPFDLPDSGGKITILFDLDETLLHTQVTYECNSVNSGDWGSAIEICTENGDYFVNLKIRPHAVQVLKRLREKFELGVFTASQEPYGRAVLGVLDPDSTIFSFGLFRQHCVESQFRANHVKDLRILKDRDPSKLILIDNSPQAYLFQKNNAVPVIPFFTDKEDTQLLKLQIFLNNFQKIEDVRPVLREYFKLDQYHSYKNMLKLVRQLY